MRNRKAIPVCLERSIAVSTNIWAGLFIDLHEAPEMSIPLQTTVYHFYHCLEPILEHSSGARPNSPRLQLIILPLENT